MKEIDDIFNDWNWDEDDNTNLINGDIVDIYLKKTGVYFGRGEIRTKDYNGRIYIRNRYKKQNGVGFKDIHDGDKLILKMPNRSFNIDKFEFKRV